MTSFWGELKRRNVVRVAIAYAVVSWLLLQFADVILDNIEAPTWVFQAIQLPAPALEVGQIARSRT